MPRVIGSACSSRERDCIGHADCRFARPGLRAGRRVRDDAPLHWNPCDSRLLVGWVLRMRTGIVPRATFGAATAGVHAATSGFCGMSGRHGGPEGATHGISHAGQTKIVQRTRSSLTMGARALFGTPLGAGWVTRTARSSDIALSNADGTDDRLYRLMILRATCLIGNTRSRR